MASNPMQRKIRNAVLISVLITMIIMGAIGGLFAFKIYKKQKEEEATIKKVYILAKDMDAGESLIQSNVTILKLVDIDTSVVPSTAITQANMGKLITSETISKIALKSGTILTEEMLTTSEDAQANDTREQEYNMILLPSQLQKNDYIDIRLTLPSGEDFIVASKKKVIDTDETTVWINVSESEILTISNAIVEAYELTGSKLYATTYVEPGLQESATTTYIPSDAISRLISRDPNVVDEAKKALSAKINSDLYKERSEVLRSALESIDAEKAIEDIENGVEESIKTQNESREEYLKELESTSTANSTKK